MFAKQINDALTFFGPQSLNVKKLKHRFSSITGNDFDTWFLDEQALQQAQAAAQTAAAGNPAAPGSPGAITPPGAPSIAGAAAGAAPAQAMGSVMR